MECDNESFIDNMGGVYVCEGCRKGPLVGGDAMLPSAMDSTDDQDFSSIAKRILGMLLKGAKNIVYYNENLQSSHKNSYTM